MVLKTCQGSFFVPAFGIIISVRDTAKVPAQVPEDSWVLRERRLLFPTSDRLETWLIPSGMIRCRGALSTPGYLLALLRELSQCPRGLTENVEAKQVRKTNRTDVLYQIGKMVRKSIRTFRT